MRIQRLEVSNFLRVRSVTIVPDKNVVRIKGKNKAGKSSILKAIQAALGGRKLHPPKPVHDGAEEAVVKIDLGEFLVEATWKDDRCELVVRTPDGAKVRSPQAVLDGFCAKISFDPLSFMKHDPKTQVDVLRQLSGVDFTALERERSELYAKRTDVGRDRDKAVAQGAGAPAGEPPPEVSLSELTAQIQAISDAEAEARRAADTWVRAVASHQEALKQAVNLRTMLEAALKTVEEAARKDDATKAEQLAAKARVTAMGDATALREKLRTAEADNARIRDLSAKRAKKLEGEAHAKWYDTLTKKIDEIDAKKRKMVAAAKLPVEGLDFTGAEVMFGGRPLSQASDREQVLISAAIGHSLNPRLAALLIREGAFLDEDGWKALGAWAEELDVQVLIEDVGTDGAGILIEDGMVVEGDPVAEFPRKSEPLAKLAVDSAGSNGGTPEKSLRVFVGDREVVPGDVLRVTYAEAMLLGDDDEDVADEEDFS